jgi:predicted solute-binding protein
MSRPQLSEDDRHDERVAAYFTAEEKQMLLALGKMRGTGAGPVVRDLVKAKLRELEIATAPANSTERVYRRSRD